MRYFKKKNSKLFFSKGPRENVYPGPHFGFRRPCILQFLATVYIQYLWQTVFCRLSVVVCRTFHCKHSDDDVQCQMLSNVRSKFLYCCFVQKTSNTTGDGGGDNKKIITGYTCRAQTSMLT